MFLDEAPCIRIIVIRCGNEFTRNTSRRKYYDLDEKRLATFVEMWRVAKAVADRVVLIGLGTVET